jgi:hypothetical protein
MDVTGSISVRTTRSSRSATAAAASAAVTAQDSREDGNPSTLVEAAATTDDNNNNNNNVMETKTQGTPPRTVMDTKSSNTVITILEASKEEKLQKFLAAQKLLAQQKQPPLSPSKIDEDKNMSYQQCESLVMQDLRDICHHFSRNNTPTQIQIQPSKRVDLFGSFLHHHSNDHRHHHHHLNPYEFFDTNESGEIILSIPPPMFPEEFSNDSTDPEHGPTWWGIVAPKLGVGKYHGPPPPPPPTTDLSMLELKPTQASIEPTQRLSTQPRDSNKNWTSGRPNEPPVLRHHRR